MTNNSDFYPLTSNTDFYAVRVNSDVQHSIEVLNLASAYSEVTVIAM